MVLRVLHLVGHMAENDKLDKEGNVNPNWPVELKVRVSLVVVMINLLHFWFV